MGKDQWTFWPPQYLLCYAFLMFLPFYHYIMTFCTLLLFCLEIYILGHKYDYTCFLLFTICLEYHLQFFHFESVCIFRIEKSVLKIPCSSVLIFNPPHHSVPFDLVSPSIYISDDCWYVIIYYCEFIFCFLIVSYLYCFFFLVFLSF